MRIVRLILPLVVIGAVIYFFYTLVIIPLFFHSAKVVHLVDGDTMLVKDGSKLMQVQLIGVDAPENGQCFDQASTHFIAENFLSQNQDVRLVKDDALGDKDNGGRLLRYVYLKNGDLLNEKILAGGFAQQYIDPQKKYQQQDRLAAAQKEAQTKTLGVWNPQGCNGK